MSVGAIEFAVLGMLRLRPMTGYEIKSAYERGPANFMPISYGQIYPVLAKLQKQKLVIADKKPGARGSIRFSISRSGQDLLHEWLVAAAPVANHRELLLRLFFASGSELPRLEPAIRHFHQQQQAQLDGYDRTGKWLDEAHAGNPRLALWKLVMHYGVLQSQAHMRWAERAIEFTEVSRKRT